MILNKYNTNIKINLIIYPRYQLIIKRFVTGGKNIVPFKKIIENIPKPPPYENTAIILYNPEIIQKLIAFRNSSNPELASKYHIVEINKKIPINNTPISRELNQALQKVLDYYVMILPDRTNYKLLNDFINVHIDLKRKISEENLKKIFLYLQTDMVHYDHVQKEHILVTLRNYFKKEPLNIADASTFLNICNKHDHHFIITFEIIKKEKQLNSSKIQEQEEKQYVEDEIKKNILIIKKLFITYQNNPEQMLYSKEFQEWCTFLESHKISFDLIKKDIEIEIYPKLKELYNKYAPSKIQNVTNKKDNLKEFKTNSNLPNYLQNMSEQPLLPEDFELEIKKIESALFLLKHNNLSSTDLNLLSIVSGASTVDEEGTFKLSRAAYNSFSENTELLGFKYLKTYPNYNHIMSQIENKTFLIAKETSSTNQELIPAHLSHKTLIVFDKLSNKPLIIRIGFSTSTINDTTISLDNCQPTNPDPEKRKKEQRFRIFSHFIVADEPLVVDLEMTLYFYGNNSNGDSLVAKISDAFEHSKNEWLNNAYQESYNINEEFKRKLTILFYENKLKALEQKYKILQDELNKLSSEEYRDKLNDFKKQKQKLIEDKENQRYFSKLPAELKSLNKILKLLETLSAKEEERKKAKNDKMVKEQATIDYKEKNNKIHAPAKEKKEEYIKEKQAEKDANKNNNNVQQDQ